MCNCRIGGELSAMSQFLSYPVVGCANARALLTVHGAATCVASCISACAQTRVNTVVMRTRTVWIMWSAITRLNRMTWFVFRSRIFFLAQEHHFLIMNCNEVRVNCISFYSCVETFEDFMSFIESHSRISFIRVLFW